MSIRTRILDSRAGLTALLEPEPDRKAHRIFNPQYRYGTRSREKPGKTGY